MIFDLGGVIVDLDVDRTIKGFAAISGLPHQEVERLYQSNPAFNQYEKGEIDSSTFRHEIKKLFNSSNVSDETLDDAWNAMLVAIPKGKLELLLRLKKDYRVMILSNTNDIHVDCIHDKMLPEVSSERSLEPFAHKVYYSYQLKLRKPEPAIYRYVMEENNLSGAETIFLDDNENNIAAAKAVGLGTIYVNHPDEVYEIFK